METDEFNKTAEKTSNYINRIISENNIVGLSIALVYDGKIVWADGFGWADKEKKIPAEINTVYMLGSGSKTITTAALLQYLDKGILNLDEQINKYIPELKMMPRFNHQDKELTVRRLLNHHSGLPGDLYNNMGVDISWEKWGNNLYADWLIDYLNNDYLSYKPGEIAIYCNTGFILAGEIVKRLSGEKKASFNELVTANLLIPLGMKNSSFNIIKNNLAKGYIQGKSSPPIQFNGIAGATGGLFTDVNDMSKFISMLLNQGSLPSGKRILSSEAVAEMGIPEISPLDVNSYFIPGLGFDCVKDASLEYAGRTWIKDGSTGNYNSIMGLLPDKKLGVIILTNCDTSHLLKYSIMRECLKNALDEKFDLKPVQPKLSDMKSVPDFGQIIGDYVHLNGVGKIVRSSNDDELLWIVNSADNSGEICKRLKFNGKRFSLEGATEEIVFKNIDNHFIMIQYGSNGSETDKYEYNNYVIKIIAAKGKKSNNFNYNKWKKRLDNRYLIDNIGWNSLGLDDDLFLNIREKDKEMFLCCCNDRVLIRPVSKSVAYLQGLDNRMDSSVRFTGKNYSTINYGGYTGVNIKNILDITGRSIIEEQDMKFPETLWYKIDADKGPYKFEIQNPKGRYKLRLFNDSFKFITSDINKLKYNLVQKKYYLAVTRMPGSSDKFNMKIFTDISNNN